MLQRFDSSVPRLVEGGPPVGSAVPDDFSAGSVLRLPGGAVAADFRPMRDATKHRQAGYELLVFNDTPAPVATFAYAVLAPGTHGQLTWNAIVVPPFSAIAIEIDVAIPRRGRPRVVADLFAGETQLTLDAPPCRREPGIARRLALVAAAVLLVALGADSIAANRPHVLALAAPDSVPAGTPFSVAYALAGATDGRYVVETPDGMQIRRGALGNGAGAFTVALPKTALSSGYDVRVLARGRFGSDERSTHVLAVPAPSGRPAAQRKRAPLLRLGALALARDVVRGGESIVVAYRPSEDPGVVRLIDALGTVRAEALLNPRGRSILVAPQVETDQDFRIVATAQRGSGRDEATAPVTIFRAPAPAPSALATAPAVTVPKSAAPIAVEREQIAGRGIVIRVDRNEPNLHVALMGPTTQELAGADVPPGARSIVLDAPKEPAHAHYEIVATYSAGHGQETLIRPVTFRAP